MITIWALHLDLILSFLNTYSISAQYSEVKSLLISKFLTVARINYLFILQFAQAHAGTPFYPYGTNLKIRIYYLLHSICGTSVTCLMRTLLFRFQTLLQ